MVGEAGRCRGGRVAAASLSAVGTCRHPKLLCWGPLSLLHYSLLHCVCYSKSNRLVATHPLRVQCFPFASTLSPHTQCSAFPCLDPVHPHAPGGSTAAAATTGPANGPRPASSTPTTAWYPCAHSRCSAARVGPLLAALLLLFLLLPAFCRLVLGEGGAAAVGPALSSPAPPAVLGRFGSVLASAAGGAAGWAAVARGGRPLPRLAGGAAAAAAAAAAAVSSVCCTSLRLVMDPSTGSCCWSLLPAPLSCTFSSCCRVAAFLGLSCCCCAGSFSELPATRALRLRRFEGPAVSAACPASWWWMALHTTHIIVKKVLSCWVGLLHSRFVHSQGLWRNTPVRTW
jgi:hypothetical protein